MEIVPLCPFEAGAFLWEAQPGQPSLTVIVKGTFALAPGELAIAGVQDPLGEERHFEDSALASLYWPGDFAPVKRKVDVMLVGHAYAPGGHPTPALAARLTVGEHSKVLHVFGDRVWTREPSGQVVPSAPQPFTRMPIRYERAPLSADNPVGMDGVPSNGSPAVPNLEIEGEGGIPCFGPISPQWRSRRVMLDDSSTFWAYGVARAPREGAPSVGSAPPRFDFAFFNAAPPDQQIDLLRAGAPLVLDNLDPEHPRLEARLPAMRPQVFRVPPPEVAKGRVEEIILRCDSLWIDTDRRVVVLTWRGLTDVAGGLTRVGTLVVDADPTGKKLRWDRVEKRFAEARPPTLRLGSEGGSSSSSARKAPVATGPDPLAVRYDGLTRARPPEAQVAARTPTLTEAVGPVSLAAESIRDDPTNPLPGSPKEPVAMGPQAAPNPGALRAPEPGFGHAPTVVAPSSTPAPPAPTAVVPAPAKRPMPSSGYDGAASGPKPRASFVGSKTRPPSPQKPTIPRAGGSVPPIAMASEAAGVEEPTVPKLASAKVPIPPVASGAKPKPSGGSDRASKPLMVLGASAPVPAAQKPPLGGPPPPVAPEPQGAPKSQKPASTPILRKDLDITRYGTICADLARKGANRGAVLKAHLLTEPAWSLVDHHWKRAMADEAEEGGRELLLAYDEAYLAAQQRLGTPIGAAEYARIQVAIERGEVGRVLGELSLELGDLMRLQRVWTKRLAESPELAAELARSVEEARWA